MIRVIRTWLFRVFGICWHSEGYCVGHKIKHNEGLFKTSSGDIVCSTHLPPANHTYAQKVEEERLQK